MSKGYDQKSIDRLCTVFEPEPVAGRIENEFVLLCFAGANLVGTVGLRGDYLRSMLVEPAYQGRGFGKVLVARIEEEARKKRYQKSWFIPR
ncbi:GNAT family N-acetyltransferase [uncultured Roseobacter sp.]|uniref:GNAT family N-acetyltransferase n=1 Tax=uncultured Roseobacter sp. TaxID=114847 RepID=UPI0034597F03